jgi:8-amino-7-oxononanoate synthase
LVNEEPWRRERVLKLARLAHDELRGNAPFAGSQIIPVIIGADEAALSVAQQVQDAGFDVRAIRPPTVPEGTARLRVSINAGHSEDQIRALGMAIRAARNS